jgi:hypothetical protein
MCVPNTQSMMSISHFGNVGNNSILIHGLLHLDLSVQSQKKSAIIVSFMRL